MDLKRTLAIKLCVNRATRESAVRLLVCEVNHDGFATICLRCVISWVRRHFRGQHKKCESRGITQRCQRYVQQFALHGITLVARSRKPSQTKPSPAAPRHLSSGSSTCSDHSMTSMMVGAPFLRDETAGIDSGAHVAPLVGEGMGRRVSSANSLPDALPRRPPLRAPLSPRGRMETVFGGVKRKTSPRLLEHQCQMGGEDVPGGKRRRFLGTWYDDGMARKPVSSSSSSLCGDADFRASACIRVYHRKYERNPIPVSGKLAEMCASYGCDMMVEVAGYLPDGSVWHTTAQVCPTAETYEGSSGAELYLPLPAPRLPHGAHLRVRVSLAGQSVPVFGLTLVGSEEPMTSVCEVATLKSLLQARDDTIASLQARLAEVARMRSETSTNEPTPRRRRASTDDRLSVLADIARVVHADGPAMQLA